jgi:hypothetical protein
MSRTQFHTIYFESMGHRARLSIHIDSIDMFLDLMLYKEDIVIVDRNVYYNNMPDVDSITSNTIRFNRLPIGRCEEYQIN